MTDALQGRFSYPGIQQWEDVDFTDISGISPSMCTVSVYPQEGYPDANGDITFTYGDNSIAIKNCHIDAARYVQNTGGQIVQVTIMDERWKWKFGTISGRYNFKNVKAYDAAFTSGPAVGFVDPQHEKKPQELAILLIQAMGYANSDWDVTRLPNDARPEVNWTQANPAQELHNLADQFGLRIVPIRSTGSWALVVTGEGNDLPSGIPYTPDVSHGFDPAEIPDWIRIVTAPTLYEVRFHPREVLIPLSERTSNSSRSADSANSSRMELWSVRENWHCKPYSKTSCCDDLRARFSISNSRYPDFSIL
jgi:hypothetical protein